MSKFYEIEPSLENYWRAVILFGRNVASYKFALAKSLHELKVSANRLGNPLDWYNNSFNELS